MLLQCVANIVELIVNFFIIVLLILLWLIHYPIRIFWFLAAFNSWLLHLFSLRVSLWLSCLNLWIMVSLFIIGRSISCHSAHWRDFYREGHLRLTTSHALTLLLILALLDDHFNLFLFFVLALWRRIHSMRRYSAFLLFI